MLPVKPKTTGRCNSFEARLKSVFGVILYLVPASATDPDGDNVSFSFWQYDDADTYAGLVKITDSGNGKITFTIPEDARTGSKIIPEDTIHIIVEGKDNSPNPITRYQRVIVKIIGEEIS